MVGAGLNREPANVGWGTAQSQTCRTDLALGTMPFSWVRPKSNHSLSRRPNFSARTPFQIRELFLSAGVAVHSTLVQPPEKMVRKRFQQAKTGLEALKSLDANKYLKKIGLGREDFFFWKQVGKALLCTYTIFGIAWIYNETSPLGWWTLKPRPKEERELAHLYERREFPYPGDTEAMEEFIAKGGMIGTTIGPKGIVETDRDAVNYQKDMEKKKFEQEAQKLWLRMRNEVISELQEKGYDIE